MSEDELNAELKKIEDQVTAQGGTLADALAQQGLTEEVLRKQVRLQIKVEKLLADKIAVTNEEVETFITENKLPLPTTDAEAAREMVRDQLKDQKMQQGAQALVEGLRSSAKIKYYTNY